MNTTRIGLSLSLLLLAATTASALVLPDAGGAEIRSEMGPARAAVDSAMHWVATGIEITGVGIIVVGAITATFLFLYGGLVTVGWPDAFRRYRANLGRGILLGLELLVAADIIGTVAVTPSFRNLAVLGLIVLIRTFLSFSLEVEIEGRWPWQRLEQGAPGERVSDTRERL